MWISKKRYKRIIDELVDTISNLRNLIDYYKDKIYEIRKEIEGLDEYFVRCLYKNRPTQLFLSTIINNSKFIIMDLTIQADQKTIASLLLMDNVTKQPVTGATFSNVAATPSDPTLFATSENADGSVNTVPLREGTGTLKVDALVNYTNSLGAAVSEQKSVTVNVTITAASTGTGGTGTANETVLDLSFSAPTAK